MGKGGYTRRQMPEKGAPLAIFGGIETSGNPLDFLEGDALTAREHPDNSKAQGSNPSMPTTVPFANGKDMRNR
jgi:hypothetical protein